MATVGERETHGPTRRALAAGVVAPVVFVLTFTVDGWLRAGYDPMSMFVSELSIGPGGWVQKANFVVTGLLVVVFAIAAARTTRPSRAARVAATTLAVMGACLAGSGFATTDHAVLFTQLSPEGRVHGVLGAVVFLGILVSTAAVAADRDEARSWRRVSWAVVGVEAVGIAALKLAELSTFGLFAEKGLVQRVCLVVFLAWLAVHAARLRRCARPRQAQHHPS